MDPCGSGERDKWHKGYVRWVCKSCRPPSLGETDKFFRDYVDLITYSRYKPPCEDTAQKVIVEWSAEIDILKGKRIAMFRQSGILPSVAADIWGENGKSLYALLLYFINDEFEMEEILLDCLPFSGLAHNAMNIESACKKALSAVGIGEFKPDADPPVDTCGEECFGSTVDEASVMTKAFSGFEGAPCVCHKINNALKTAAKTEFMLDLDSRVRGVASHFRRSDKVNSCTCVSPLLCLCNLLCYFLVIDLISCMYIFYCRDFLDFARSFLTSVDRMVAHQHDGLALSTCTSGLQRIGLVF